MKKGQRLWRQPFHLQQYYGAAGRNRTHDPLVRSFPAASNSLIFKLSPASLPPACVPLCTVNR